MKFLFLPLVFITFIFNSCQNSTVRKKPPVPKSATDLVTGCYYIVEDSTKLKRELSHSPYHEVLYIDPKPILTVTNFKEVTISDKEGFSLFVELDGKGKSAWSIATEKYAGKKLAFIIDNVLVMAPTVLGKIDGGSFQVSGNFTEEEMETLFKKIHHEMYED